MRDATAAVFALIGRSKAGPVDVPEPARPAVAYAAVSALYLRKLERAGCDLYADGLEPSRFRGQLAIIRSKMTGKV